MTQPASLPEIALTFAKECMGWRDGDLTLTHPNSPDGYYVFCKLGGPRFFFTDLNAVLVEAVQDWLEDKVAERSWFMVSLTTKSDWTHWRVSFCNEQAEHHDLRHALMSACVAANRKLREPA